MEKYEVEGLLGEGSFGRVYKAKQLADSKFVALKVISKRGRSAKELKGLRRECEIQRCLNHPNIIQMLDSFETENEIVVITEFAHKELNYMLGKEGYLSEDRVQAIVWDLVSALYYLHSHRVLHRDLKPQNILLDANNVAKLCDFGFARNMSTGTHVLTSIKGTPLYMAPELIEEQPYDHNADLWSLGCIVYELLVGAPPFCTASILHLIRLIRHEQIQWPTFISENCVSFLKGLLQKNPAKRMTWPEILNHPFVKGHVVITETVPAMPLTRPMSANTLQIKEQQRNQRINQKNSNKSQNDSTKSVGSKGSGEENCERNKNVEDKLLELSLSEKSPDLKVVRAPLNFHEDNQPIESEEWVVFLEKTMEEIMNCEIGCLLQASSTNVLVGPLKNSNASSKVINYVANLFSLPFVVRGIEKDTMEQIMKVYLEVKLVPNLVYATKLMTTKRNFSSTASTPTTPTAKSTIELNDEDLQAIEAIYLLLCYLVYRNDHFLNQFCDSVVVLKQYELLRKLFSLSKRRIKIVNDLVAILTHVLRKVPDNCDILEKILSSTNDSKNPVDFVGMLRSGNALLRERCCYFLLFLGRTLPKIVENLWNEMLRETIEALMYDSIENVRNGAELVVEELKDAAFYDTQDELSNSNKRK